ncbi:MAG TPA: ABC transporter permease [Vicinamibacterales bacterium]|nr:ABC transporter permease [Vicinamibacterales bacterium]
MPMLRGFWKLTWVEIKIFVREPLGVVGSVGVPVFVFIVLGRALGGRAGASRRAPEFAAEVPALGAMLIALGAVLSLITIVALYRDAGILKRLRATPLRPQTILAAHVAVKLLFTAITLVLMILAGRRFYPIPADVPIFSFTIALLFTTFTILSLGFLIASIVPTARFAQPIGTAILYPMLGLSGLFVPVSVMPPPLARIARLLPLTYAASLLRGIWQGDGWLAHATDVGVLVLVFAACTALSARVFRWE